MGTSYQDKFITDRAGTGKWEWYARVVYCGASGSFSSGGHVYLSANSGYSATSVTWYLSYCNLIDITKGAYDGLRTRYADSADSVAWGNVTGKPSSFTPATHTHTFASLTSKPTTISGYGITDALTTSNFNSYAPKLDGTGASGTWGINISGNAASATKLANSRTIWGQSFDGTSNVDGNDVGTE